jgi:hypothetical protein
MQESSIPNEQDVLGEDEAKMSERSQIRVNSQFSQQRS